jgi:putative (di)nucleoside polyphosphate hydrolase
VDQGEDPREAALRELWEETGIDAGLVDIVGETDDWLRYDLPLELVPKLWKARYRGQKQKWFLMLFNGSDEDINIETSHPEFSQWRWLPATELVENIVPFKRHIYVAVLEAFDAHF